MTSTCLYRDIEHEEGRRRVPYLDTKGILTNGVGHTGPDVHASDVWTDAHIDLVLNNDVAAVIAGLNSRIPWWRSLNDNRQDVLVQMAFQMGVDGLMQFTRTLGALKAGRCDQAADYMLQSKWAREDSPARAARMSAQIRSGMRAWAHAD